MCWNWGDAKFERLPPLLHGPPMYGSGREEWEKEGRVKSGRGVGVVEGKGGLWCIELGVFTDTYISSFPSSLLPPKHAGSNGAATTTCCSSSIYPTTCSSRASLYQYLKLGGKHSHSSPIPVIACTFHSKTHSHPPPYLLKESRWY